MKKTISFDIWDTILKRKCHPEEIKLHTCKYLFLQYNKYLKEEIEDIYMILKYRNDIETKLCLESFEKGNNHECNIKDVFKELLIKVFKDSYKSDKLDINEIKDKLLKVEIEKEKEMIYINPDIIEVFEKYKDYDMYCISDFYMSKEELLELFKHVKLPYKFKKMYSSADYFLNKREGHLYDLVIKENNIDIKEHIHVGDNDHSDIKMAKEKGIETIKIKNNTHFDFACRKNRDFKFDFTSLQKEDNTIENRLFNYGLILSPIVYFFVNNIIEYAIKNGYEEIFYMTREGENFIKIHDVIASSKLSGIKVPEGRLLEVSRVATFAPSLKEFSKGELLRLWSQYRVQSMEGLFKSLDIEISKFNKYFEKHNVDTKQVYHELWFNADIANLFLDEEFITEMNKELDVKKNSINKYFEKNNVDKKDKMLTVDIGWRGTIQDNLCYMLKDTDIKGFYFALFDYYNAQPINSKKFAYFNGREITWEYMAYLITAFELLFNPNSGSVIGYKEGVAIRKHIKEELEIVNKYTSHIQEGMIEASKYINEYLVKHPFMNDEFKEYVIDIMKELKTNPSKDFAYVYFNLIHNDTFGTGEYTDKKSDANKVGKYNALEIRKKLKNQTWKEIFLKYNDIYYINDVIKLTNKTKNKVRSVVNKIRKK